MPSSSELSEIPEGPHPRVPRWVPDVVATGLVVLLAFVQPPALDSHSTRTLTTVLMLTPVVILPVRRRRPLAALVALLSQFGAASVAGTLSLNLAQEVTKGLVQKASIGGTPHKAPIGYLNFRTTDPKGREVRDVQLDPNRAELVQVAFTAYATGDWSLSKLARELETRGLTNRPTPTFPAKLVTTAALHKILTNPLLPGHRHLPRRHLPRHARPARDPGDVRPGADDPRAEPRRRRQTAEVRSLPQRLDLLRVREAAHVRSAPQLPERRLRLLHLHRPPIQAQNCQRTAVLTHRVEQSIETRYQQVSVTADEAAQIKGVLGQVFDTLAESISDEQKVLAGQKAKLEAEQDRIRASLQVIMGRLDTLETPYAKAKVGLDAILGLLTDIGDVYAKAGPAERRMLNRALFDRITINDEDQATLEPVEAISTILAADPRPHNERTLPRHQAEQGSLINGGRWWT